MKNGTCPHCNSTDIYMTDFSPLQAGDGLVRVYNHNGNNFPIEMYLCPNCGHIEIGVAESHKARIGELLKSDKWKKVA